MNDWGKPHYSPYSNKQMAAWRAKTRSQWLGSLRNSRGNRVRR